MTTKKPAKKSSVISPFPTSSWFDIDRSINNFRKEMENIFSSFPEMSTKNTSYIL